MCNNVIYLNPQNLIEWDFGIIRRNCVSALKMRKTFAHSDGWGVDASDFEVWLFKLNKTKSSYLDFEVFF